MRIAAALLVVVALLGCGPKSMSARRANSETRANQLDDALTRLEKAMSQLDVARSEKEAEEARRLSLDPDLPLYPEYGMLTDRLAEDEKKLPQVRKVREKRDLEEAVAKQKANLEAPLAAWKKAAVALDGRAVTKAQVDDAAEAEKDLRKVLADGASLVERDPGYTALAKDIRNQLEKAAPVAALALAKAVFIEGPGAQKVKASAELKEARATNRSDDKLSHAKEALAALKECSEQGQKQVAASPVLSKAVLQIDGAITTTDGVLAWCSSSVKEAQKLATAPPVKKKGKTRAK